MRRMTAGRDQAKEFYTKGASISGAVYTANAEHWDFISEVMRMNIESNPLHMVQFANIN